MPSVESRTAIDTLVLTLVYPHQVSYYDDWLDAFVASADFRCTVLNILGLSAVELRRALERAEAIIVLHSCNADTLDYLRQVAPVLGDRRRGKLLAFVGNEYNSPYLSTRERVSLLRSARCDIIATQLLDEAGQYLYAATGAQVASVPHALNPNVFKSSISSANCRPIDVGIRGYRYPAFLGDDDRNRLLIRVSETCPAFGLSTDMVEDVRLDRARWAEFLGRCNGTVSTEAGSWFIEPDDVLMSRIRAYLDKQRRGAVIRSDTPLRRLVRRLPVSIKVMLWKILRHGPIRLDQLDDINMPFAELESLFFRTAPRPPVYGKAVSSRHFDAIGTKTCQIMLRGRFNDILVADEHYISIAPGYGNLEHAITLFKDPDHRRRIVDGAYDHVMSAHTHVHRVRLVRDLLEAG